MSTQDPREPSRNTGSIEAQMTRAHQQTEVDMATALRRIADKIQHEQQPRLVERNTKRREAR